MNRTLKSLILKIFSYADIFPTIITPEEDIRNLISDLRPVVTDKDLIRIGPDGDGGYLVPDDLEGIEACFSPGVGEISGFEKECAERGMNVYLADGSVNRPAESHDLFAFTRKNVGAFKNDSTITMDEWIYNVYEGKATELLLQMDIEGREYETILSLNEDNLRKFRILVIEFHKLDQLFSRPFFRIASGAFEKLLSNHTCVHIHPNNCSETKNVNGISIPEVMEFTFYRNDRFKRKSYAKSFPHPKDFNNSKKKTLILPRIWHDF